MATMAGFEKGSTDLTYPDENNIPLPARYKKGGVSYKSLKRQGSGNSGKKFANAKGLRDKTARAAAHRGIGAMLP